MILSLLWRLFFAIASCAVLIMHWPIPIIPSAFAADERQHSTTSRCYSDTTGSGINGGMGLYPPRRGTAEEADLKVLVPLIHTFPQFVNCSDPANVMGVCVEVFERALSLLPPPPGKPSFTLNYTCLALSNVNPTGAHNITYDFMIKQLNQKGYDVVVGDITIEAKRLSEADFTQPFMPSGIVIFSKRLKVFYDIDKPSSWLLFLAPFTARTWCIIFAVSIFTGLVLAMVEYHAHFQGRHEITFLEQFQELSGLVTKGLILLEREPIQSGIGRLLMVAWLFFALLLSQSYNAGLNSYMTAEQLSLTRLDMNYIKSSTMRIGHWGDSVVKGYLIDRFHIPEEKLIAFSTLDNYKGNLTQEVDVVVVDELPYVNLVLSNLSSPCDYMISNRPLTSEGFGLALRKGSNWTPKLSTAILNLSESGCLDELSNNLKGSHECEEREGYPTQIGLTSTLLLVVPLVTVHLACIFIHSLKPHKRFWAIGSHLYHAFSRHCSLRNSSRYFSSRVGFDASNESDDNNN